MNEIKITLLLRKTDNGYKLKNIILDTGKIIEKKKKRPPKPRASLTILDDPTVRDALKEQFPLRNVNSEIEKAKDWLASKGKVYKDYVAFMRNWLRQDYESKKKGKTVVIR